MRPAAFLDRDDTLIRCTGHVPGGDLGDPGLVQLLPDAAEACKLLSDTGLQIVVVTNQGGVARGRYTTDDVNAVHERLDQLLQDAGAPPIAAFRFCPFHPEGTVEQWAREHPWRKPAPGMLLDAAEVLDLDLSRSWMIGDAERDVLAGHAAGCSTIRIAPAGTPTAADLLAPTLLDAARRIASLLGAPS